jgi:hypothetical protein
MRNAKIPGLRSYNHTILGSRPAVVAYPRTMNLATLKAPDLNVPKDGCVSVPSNYKAFPLWRRGGPDDSYIIDERIFASCPEPTDVNSLRARLNITITESIKWLKVKKLVSVTFVANVVMPASVNVTFSFVGWHPSDVA